MFCEYGCITCNCNQIYKYLETKVSVYKFTKTVFKYLTKNHYNKVQIQYGSVRPLIHEFIYNFSFTSVIVVNFKGEIRVFCVL